MISGKSLNQYFKKKHFIYNILIFSNKYIHKEITHSTIYFHNFPWVWGGDMPLSSEHYKIFITLKLLLIFMKWLNPSFLRQDLKQWALIKFSLWHWLSYGVLNISCPPQPWGLHVCTCTNYIKPPLNLRVMTSQVDES